MKIDFNLLPDEFKDAVATKTVEELNLTIAEVAKGEAVNQEAKEDDEDLASLKEQVKDASAPYSEGTKMNKTKIAFLRQALKDKGSK